MLDKTKSSERCSNSTMVVLSFNGGLGLLACKMKHLGYPLDCNVDITRCSSLIRSDFVVGIFAARSVNDLTTAHLCILGWCNEKDR